MLELELTDAPATLESLKLRVEKVGPDSIPAADLRLTCPQDADVLAHFSPTLKAMLFNEHGPRDLADGLPLRDPHMVYPLERDEVMHGARVLIGYGVGDPMCFEDAKINKFHLTPMEGGGVVVGFRVQCRPSELQVGRLYLLQEQDVTLTVEPCEPPES